MKMKDFIIQLALATTAEVAKRGVTVGQFAKEVGTATGSKITLRDAASIMGGGKRAYRKDGSLDLSVLAFATYFGLQVPPMPKRSGGGRSSVAMPWPDPEIPKRIGASLRDEIAQNGVRATAKRVAGLVGGGKLMPATFWKVVAGHGTMRTPLAVALAQAAGLLPEGSYAPTNPPA